MALSVYGGVSFHLASFYGPNVLRLRWGVWPSSMGGWFIGSIRVPSFMDDLGHFRVNAHVFV